MRHPPAVIETVQALRKRGHTLGEIVAKTNLPKTTVFHHIKKIVKSEELKIKLAFGHKDRMKNFAANRRGKSFKLYPYWEPTEWTPRFVNLVAHFIFDGAMKRTSAIYNNRSEILINSVASLMDELLGVSDYKLYKDKNGVTRISYNHVQITAFLRNKAVELLEYISNASNDEKLAFLKAFFDDEGNVSLTFKHKIVRGYQHSIVILELVQKLLSDLGIFSRIQPKFYEICISRKADIIRFRNLINFSEGVCINGARLNSVWGKSLEKREILENLIESYHG
jgi:hypothetical protein